MTPTEIKSIRERAGLTQDQLARMLRISDSRSIRRWEDGSRKVSGPVSILMEMIEAGTFPDAILTRARVRKQGE
tara:strand:- start:135 stop:356 length:222 start_codon:yes stop_codon:yes gene_type:complete